jgi:predicted regulator of Ras-like GTPase activity (Roadblock/LC7/MglB family)
MFEHRAESARDQSENAFTVILRRLYTVVPAMMAAVFVDTEGECIDYVAAIDPFEAKVSAAHMHMLMGSLRSARLQATAGDAHAFELVAGEREAWVRHVGDDYVLVVILAHGFDRAELRDAMARAGREFRAEVGITSPSWEGHDRLSVRLRASLGWTYAPDGFCVRGERFTIAAVLGRWVEQSKSGDSPVVCFRVRTQQGQELTLALDERADAWVVKE